MLFRKPKLSSFNKACMQIIARWMAKSDNSCWLVVFTSRARREGVSTIARGMARSFAAADKGKVLLLNASVRHPRKSVQLNLAEHEDLSDLSAFVTRRRKEAFDTIRLANITGIKRLPKSNRGLEAENADGAYPPGDTREVEEGKRVGHSFASESWHEQYRRLLEVLKESYNIILVDAGSLTNPNGTFWLANGDVNILVVDCTRTTRDILEYQRREFENSQISIHGSILNKRRFPIPSFLYWLTR